MAAGYTKGGVKRGGVKKPKKAPKRLSPKSSVRKKANDKTRTRGRTLGGGRSSIGSGHSWSKEGRERGGNIKKSSTPTTKKKAGGNRNPSNRGLGRGQSGAPLPTDASYHTKKSQTCLLYTSPSPRDS